MANKKVYIKATAQVSAQQPLSDNWLTAPVELQGDFVPACEPPFKEYITPMAARRMTPVLKRALVTSKSVLAHLPSGTTLDAIITGTGLGSAISSEKIINAMIEEGEAFSMPTQFMQSTHNTIGSLIAIDTKCHAYNATYSQDGISAECAMLDAFAQIRLGKISNALVGAHDELPKSWMEVMKRGNIYGNPGQVPASEISVAMLLGNNSSGANCEVAGIEVSFNTNFDTMLESFLRRFETIHADALMTGVNGWDEHDSSYQTLFDVMPQVPKLHYKHIVGESFSASAFGILASSLCLKKGIAPAILRDDSDEALTVKSILLANASKSNKSLIFLKSCD